MATNYINNDDFLNSLIEYKAKVKESKELGNPPPKIPDYIGECFLKIANNLAKRPNFYQYTYKDEMISDGVENCLMYFDNFDPAKSSNPFAYFTQIIWYAFIRRISKEKKQQYIKYKATENFGILDEEELRELGDDSRLPQLEVYQNMYDFISAFEEKEMTKKETKKSKLLGVENFMNNSE